MNYRKNKGVSNDALVFYFLGDCIKVKRIGAVKLKVLPDNSAGKAGNGAARSIAAKASFVNMLNLLGSVAVMLIMLP